MQDLFEYSDYRIIIKLLAKEQKHSFLKLSGLLNVHSSLLSHVLAGKKDLTFEQAARLSEVFSLSTIETDYFMGLLELERAGNEALRAIIKRRLAEIKNKAGLLANRIASEKVLDEAAQMRFYSAWYYSAVRLSVTLEECNDAKSIANFLNLDESLVLQVLDFLLTHSLVKETNGNLELGPRETHLPSNSSYISNHHRNLRLKVLNEQEKLQNPDFMYSSLMTISKKKLENLRSLIQKTIQKSRKEAMESEVPEEMVIVNFDCISLQKK